MIKRFLSLLLIIWIVSGTVFALPSPTKEFYINDFAGVIDSDVEKHIFNMSALVERKTGAQIVVVTVESLDSMTDSEYALKLGREWGIGDEDKDNGFLMLISTGDRALRFEVGYGLEGALPDGKCGRIQDEYMIPYLSNDNYSQGVLEGYDCIVAEVCNEYGIEIPPEVDATPLSEEEASPLEVIGFFVIMILMLIFFIKAPPSVRRNIIFGAMISGNRRSGHRGGGGGGFSGGGGSFGGGGSSRRF